MKRLYIAAAILSMLLLAAGEQPIYAASQEQPMPLSGRVIETMNGGGYTYALIEKNNKKDWVAVPQAKIDKGQDITFEPGHEMKNFESKTLKRKFEKIYFSAGVVKSATPQNPALLSGKVVETMNSGGYTYALIEKNSKKDWVAVPQTKIDKGQDIAFKPGLEMRNFESKTLKRKFEKIYFSSGIIK